MRAGGLSVDEVIETVRRGAPSAVIGAPLASPSNRFTTGDESEANLQCPVTEVQCSP
jgi:hypothetical protein